MSTDRTYQKLKVDKSKRMAELVDKETKFMRYRKVFWAWMESVVKLDRKEIYQDPEYGFEEEPENVVSKVIIEPNKL